MTSKQQGLSLIEVLISIMLLSVAMLGLFKLQAYMDRESQYAVKSIQALQAAEAKLEEFRTRSISGVSTGGGSSAIKFSEIVSGNAAVNAQGITVDWTVTQPSGSLSSSVKTIDVDGKWNDREGVTQKVSLKTMISKYSEFE